MLSLEDCIAFSGLTRDQIDAIACYKHVPPILAAEWAESALDAEEGRELVEAMLVQEVAIARSHRWPCETAWSGALADFRRGRVH